MAPPNQPRSASNENRVQLALHSIQSNQIPSLQQAATTYNIPRSTLYARRAGTRSRIDTRPNSMKLTAAEEQVITRYCLDLDARGYPPSLTQVREMANKLLDAGS